MNHERPTNNVTRDDVWTLLSDDEVARVRTMGADLHLADGDEFVDLERLDQGVRRAVEMTSSMDRLVPRSALRENTWNKVLTMLERSVPRAAAPIPRPINLTSASADDGGQP